MSQYNVIINGKDSGIVETNFAYANKYWQYRARTLGKKIVLKKVKGT